MRKFGSRWYWALLALVVIALAVTMIACPAEEEESPTPGEATPTPAEEAPTIRITSPEQNEIVTGNETTVEVEVENFELVDEIGEMAEEGRGHIIYYLDIEPPTEPNMPALPENENATWVATPDTSYTFENVTAGPHTVYVQLVNNDHTPLDPPVTDQVDFTVEEEEGEGAENET
ncbi:MAG: hypothetical protein IBX68_11070, partial [Dehalococcoidia bacterium]|nr:hypothetical protein [Dehalococcoidia bacterium]